MSNYTDVLSQEEIDQLLEAIKNGEINPEEELEKYDSGPKIRIYDFKRPDKITKRTMHNYSSFMDKMTLYWKKLLYQINNTYCDIHHVCSIELTSEEITRSIPSPTFIYELRFADTDHRAFIHFYPSIAPQIVKSFATEDDKNTPDNVILATIIEKTLIPAITKSFPFLGNPSISISDFYQNPRVIDSYMPYEMLCDTTFEIKLDDFEGMSTFAVPSSFVNELYRNEEVIRKKNTDTSKSHILRKKIEDYSITLDMMITGSSMTLSEYQNLTVGDTLPISLADCSIEHEHKKLCGLEVLF